MNMSSVISNLSVRLIVRVIPFADESVPPAVKVAYVIKDDPGQERKDGDELKPSTLS